MIALNETNGYAAEVAFTLPLDSDPLTGLTGWSFTLGEVQIKLPGSGWTDVALSRIVEKGYGRFCVRLTPVQCTVAGDVFLKADVAGTQYYFGSDVIGSLGGDIEVGGTGSIPFFLPDEVDPINGAPLTGHTFTAGQVRVCLPNAAYVNADVTQIEEIGFGGFRLNLTSAQTSLAGKVFIYASVPGYQRFEGYCTILGASSVPVEPEPPAPTPVPVPIVFGDPEYANQLSLALNRLPQQFRSGTLDYGRVDTPTTSLPEVLGVFVPPVHEYDVVIPVVTDPGVTGHLSMALGRLPHQFRSGTLVYDLPVDTTPQEIAGVFVPPVIEWDLQVPIVDDPATSNHLEVALGRLPHQFRSGALRYGGMTLDGVLEGDV